ncbi:peptidoglycan-binding protein [Pedobacter mucosus]|uniref:peptidoglycan-binding protein n=1 Tax=Pedobacter mucosus TaxID=2895286 RepID=UPI001EE4AF6C|nr:peptidoglycan-binding protein [Pedobacter mucosus]UKT65628.1 CHAP domain-containing protein [Pedobacter mucosus]
MNYPNRIIKKKEADKDIVTAIQKKLNDLNFGPIDVDGDFGKNTESAVKLFQTQNFDAAGLPLTADGQVGSVTWAALFGDATVINDNTMPSNLLSSALMIAISQINVVEVPMGSNRGPQVDVYLRRAGLNPVGAHYSWCAAFTYYCFDEASKKIGNSNPLPKTAGVLELFRRAKCTKIAQSAALANPNLIVPGCIFIIDHGGGMGHTGIVESVNGGNITTIEGNTNSALSSNGYGVFRLNRRKISQINKGFLQF